MHRRQKLGGKCRSLVLHYLAFCVEWFAWTFTALYCTKQSARLYTMSAITWIVDTKDSKLHQSHVQKRMMIKCRNVEVRQRLSCHIVVYCHNINSMNSIHSKADTTWRTWKILSLVHHHQWPLHQKIFHVQIFKAGKCPAFHCIKGGVGYTWSMDNDHTIIWFSGAAGLVNAKCLITGHMWISTRNTACYGKCCSLWYSLLHLLTHLDPMRHVHNGQQKRQYWPESFEPRHYLELSLSLSLSWISTKATLSISLWMWCLQARWRRLCSEKSWNSVQAALFLPVLLVVVSASLEWQHKPYL